MIQGAALGAAADLGRALLDLVVPRACLVCDDPMPSVPRRLCASCVEEMAGLGWQGGAALCRGCGVPGAERCVACLSSPPAFDAARAFGPWEGTLRAAVLALKFGGRTGLVAPLGAMVAHAAEQLTVTPGLVVAVPMPGARLAARGFNQAALLARAAAREMAMPFDAAALHRRTDAPHQARGTRARRAANVRNAFSAEPRAVEGREVLLVDDVLTTGATAGACARALRDAGARSVVVATVARATR